MFLQKSKSIGFFLLLPVTCYLDMASVSFLTFDEKLNGRTFGAELTIINVNSTNSKYPINATSLLGIGTKITDDDQKI